MTIKPSIQLKWIKGLKAGYASIGAVQRDLHSWLGSTEEAYVFSAEIDHIHPEDNAYDHPAGVFVKRVPPMEKGDGRDPLTISHSKELFDAVTDSFNNNLKCRLLLLKGTEYGKTKGGVKAAADGHLWQVTQLSGSVEKGYKFKVERVE